MRFGYYCYKPEPPRGIALCARSSSGWFRDFLKWRSSSYRPTLQLSLARARTARVQERKGVLHLTVKVRDVGPRPTGPRAQCGGGARRSAPEPEALQATDALHVGWLLGARTNRLTFFAARRRPEARRGHGKNSILKQHYFPYLGNSYVYTYVRSLPYF